MLRAFAHVGLNPLDFWQMTAFESRLAVEGRVKEIDREKVMSAWQIRWLISPHVERSKMPSHDDVMGVKSFSPLPGESYDEFNGRVERG